ncbi:hypothetical protein G4228_010300 [Cervus hanglu yarkandensis]|nr:hypothetical protein G4228_010300 [Cervus hanglu yarkandensis]
MDYLTKFKAQRFIPGTLGGEAHQSFSTESDYSPNDPLLPARLSSDANLSVSQSVFCGTSTYCVLNTVPPLEDDHGNSNSSHVKIFLPKKLLECLPKCSSLPKERHRWNTNEVPSVIYQLNPDEKSYEITEFKG